MAFAEGSRIQPDQLGAPRPGPPRRPCRGSGSRSGSEAAARPGRRRRSARGSASSVRRRGAAASTCRRRCVPSARPARRGRRSATRPAGSRARRAARATRGRTPAAARSPSRFGRFPRISGASSRSLGEQPASRRAARAALTPAAGRKPRPESSRAPGVASSGASPHRPPQELCGRRVADDASALEGDHPVGEAQAALEPVLGEQDRRVGSPRSAAAATPISSSPATGSSCEVGSSSTEQRRPPRERGAERDPLQLAAGELAVGRSSRCAIPSASAASSTPRGDRRRARGRGSRARTRARRARCPSRSASRGPGTACRRAAASSPGRARACPGRRPIAAPGERRRRGSAGPSPLATRSSVDLPEPEPPGQDHQLAGVDLERDAAQRRLVAPGYV